MRKSEGTIEQCRKAVMLLIGKSIIVRHNKGRNKIAVFDGVISEAYSGVFVIKIKSAIQDRMSFTYKDILCGDIRIKEKMPKTPIQERSTVNKSL
ncbi:MAG: Veg family protein [Clostridia bacterium]